MPGIVSHILAGKGEISLAQLDDWMEQAISGLPTLAGADVNEENSLNLIPVFACVRLIANTIATLPFPVYRYTKGGGKIRDWEHPLYPILHDSPNSEMTSFDFWAATSSHLERWGNSYAEIQRGAYDSQVQALWPLDPSKMAPDHWGEDGRLVYKYRLPNGQQKYFHSSLLMHIRGFGSNGITGYGPISLARQGIGLAKALEAYGATFFGNDSRPGGVLSVEGKLAKDGRDALKLAWEEAHRPLDQKHRIAVLDAGAKWQATSLPNEDAQFLECVIPGTLISMADGSRMPAEMLKPGDVVLGWDNGPVRALVRAIGTPPNKPLVRIRTARGRVLTASADHPVLTRARLRTPGGRPSIEPERWIPMSDLQPGMYVRVGLGAAEDVQLVPFDTAYFLGAMTGDGYIRQGGCSFTSSEPSVTERMMGILRDMGGGLAQTEGREYDWQIITGGVGRSGSVIRRLLNRSGLVGCHSDDKRVPLMVMAGGSAAWRGFLSGYLDTDGSVRDPDGGQKPAAYWSSINRELLEDCQHLLSLLGINSAIYLMSRGGSKLINGSISEAQPSWGLYVMGASEIRKLALVLNPVHREKRLRLARLGQCEESRYRPANFEYDSVAEVTHLPSGPSVGIEIGNCHTHITNGLVTHNSRKFQTGEIATLFGVPPHMIGDTDRSTSWGTGIESQTVGWYITALRARLVMIEQRVMLDLFTPEERRRTHKAEFVADGLLRGDAATRHETYQKGIQNGYYSINDVLRLENRNPIGPEGDRRFVNGNMVPIDQAGVQRVASPGNGQSAHLREIVREAAARVVRKEIAAMGKAARRIEPLTDAAEWASTVAEFYGDHAAFVCQNLRIERGAAERYAAEQRDALQASGPNVMDDWPYRRVDDLVRLALGGES